MSHVFRNLRNYSFSLIPINIAAIVMWLFGFKSQRDVLRGSEDVASHFVTKHSWLGKCKLIFSVGTLGITTYNHSTMEVMNQWVYSDLISISPNIRGSANLSEFLITMKNGDKTDTMRFSSDHRAEILTQALKFRHQFAESSKDNFKCNSYKYHWSDQRLPIVLQIGECSLDQRDPASNNLLASYDYKDIEYLCQVPDYSGGFVVACGGFGRCHLFASDRRDEVLKKIVENAMNFVGVSVRCRKETVSIDSFVENKFGKYSHDEAVTSICEFVVQKISPRHSDTVKRILALSKTCLLERDPSSYSIITLKPLSEIFALIRDRNQHHICFDPKRMFSIEYVTGQIRSYTSTDRDSLLVTLMDGVRASGNRDVHVKTIPTNRGDRLGPFTVPVEEAVEGSHLGFLKDLPAGWTFAQAISKFNANVTYSGLLHAVTQEGLFAENKERLINTALIALLENEGDQSTISSEDLEAQFHAFRRLFASKVGFAAFTSIPRIRERVGLKVVKALKRDDMAVTHAAIDMINTLMHPMHDNYDLRQEQLNKSFLLSSKKFVESILLVLFDHIFYGLGALIISASLDFLRFALCAPYSETTERRHFEHLLEVIAVNGRRLYELYQHPSLVIVNGVILVMKTVTEVGNAQKCHFVMKHVFKYLSIEDRYFNTSHVCTRWKNISRNPELVYHAVFTNRFKPNDISNCLRIFKNLRRVEFLDIENFTCIISSRDDYLGDVKELEIACCTFSEDAEIEGLAKMFCSVERLDIVESTLKRNQSMTLCGDTPLTAGEDVDDYYQLFGTRCLTSFSISSRNLAYVNVDLSCDIDDISFTHLIEWQGKTLKSLRLSFIEITDESFELLCSSCKNLQSLEAYRISYISWEIFLLLKKLKGLKNLSLQAMKYVDSPTIEELLNKDRAFPQLESLDLSHNKSVTDRVVEAISRNYRKLRKINLANTRVSAFGLINLIVSCRDLVEIDLTWLDTAVDQCTLETISEYLPQLEKLNISGCGEISNLNKVVKELKKSHPNLILITRL